MADLLVVHAAFAVVILVVGIALTVLARRQLAGLFLGGFVTLYGANSVYFVVARTLGISDAALAIPTILAVWARMALLVAFALVYPSLVPAGWRRRALYLLPVPVIALAILLVARPAATADLTVVGSPSFLTFVSLATGVAYPLALALLGHRWLTAPAGPFRTQAAWALIPILFWNVHDGLGFHVYPLMYGGVGLDWLVVTPVVAVGHALGLVSLAIGLALWGIALARAMRGGAHGDERAVAFVTLFLLPLTLLQVLQPGFPTGLPELHILVDNVIVFLIAYGVARSRVLDLDLKLRFGVKSGTVAAAFVAVFFVASETAALAFESLAGNALVGIVAAGALLFAFAPLQRLADRVAKNAVPVADDPQAYLTYRRFQIYSAAVEGALRDGLVDARESSSLRRLRAELGLSDEDHTRIETDLRSRSPVPMA